MKILIFVNTPAQAHMWKLVIKDLIRKGHQIKILVRDYDSTPILFQKYGLEYDVYIKPTSYKFLKGFQIITHVQRGYNLSKKFNPEIVVGFGIIETLTSLFLRKSCIIFLDSEPEKLENILNKIFADVILTPNCFRENLGKTHIRIRGFKELAYLHPNYFQPDPSIFNELGLSNNEKYVILRFNAFDAVHDIGRRGFSLSEKYRLVRELEKYARVFIRSEKELPDDLAAYNLPISFERIHHALYYAQLLVCDTGTMATEAAILGTPAVVCFSSVNRFGNFNELEQKYGLIYNYREPDKALEKAVELIQKPGLKEKWKHKREILLKDMIDVTAFMAWFIENYPDSYKNIKQNPNLQYSFR